MTFHLMIHYLLPNIDNVMHLMRLVRKGGFVSIVCVDGNRMFDALLGGNTIKIEENYRVKY